MSKTLITGIDVGTSSVHVVVAEYVRGKVEPAIVAAVQRESRGLRHGYIVNFDEAVATIKEAAREAEKIAKFRIKSSLAAIGGIGLVSSIADGSIAVARADSEITDLDIQHVIANSEKNLRDAVNRRILHTVPLYYKLDGKKVAGRPIGMKGNILEVRVMFITCVEQHADDLVSAIEVAGIKVEDIVAAPIAESYVALTRLHRNSGCILVNIGAETVSMVVFENGIPISLQVFPIGSTDITNDIALGLRIPLEEAESIKRSRNDHNQKRKIEEIIEARLSDIFDLIEAHLKKIGKSGLLPSGIILTGGGSILETIEEQARTSLRLPARVIFPRELRDPSLSTAYGLCVIGVNPDSEESLGIRIANPIKMGIMYWLKQFMP